MAPFPNGKEPFFMKGIAFEAQLCYNGKNGGANMKNDHSFFQNSQCEYFPCHKVKDSESFNCLFCYCPLYALGENCGGNFKYLDNGIKDCSACLVPHSPSGYDYINSKFPEIAQIAKKKP